MKRGLILAAALIGLIGCGGGSPSVGGLDRGDKIIVIDPGHGGQDPGAQCYGKDEKDAVLSIGLKTAKALKDAGYKVYLTRDDDHFVTLGGRTHLANRLKASLYISIHANAIARNKAAFEGLETYFLQRSRDAKSVAIAKRENGALLMGMDEQSKSMIAEDVLNGPKTMESNKLAIDVHASVLGALRAGGNRVKDLGVRSAPFWVLVAAGMPSVLIEVGYITHPKESQKIFDSSYQEDIAKGIRKGVDNYFRKRKIMLGI